MSQESQWQDRERIRKSYKESAEKPLHESRITKAFISEKVSHHKKSFRGGITF